MTEDRRRQFETLLDRAVTDSGVPPERDFTPTNAALSLIANATGSHLACSDYVARIDLNLTEFGLRALRALSPTVPPGTPGWDRARATEQLNITEMPFLAGFEPDWQGYSLGRMIAIAPYAIDPCHTFFHEMAHIVLGHTTPGNGALVPRYLREVEAEAVTLLVLSALDLPGAAHSRGYIQHWNDGADGPKTPIPARSRARILAAAETILAAGGAR